MAEITTPDAEHARARHRRLPRVAFAIIATLALVASGCGEDQVGSGERAAGTGKVVEVTVLDNTFDPATVRIQPGDTVRWTNKGRNDHNVLPADPNAGWGVQAEATRQPTRGENRRSDPLWRVQGPP